MDTNIQSTWPIINIAIAWNTLNAKDKLYQRFAFEFLLNDRIARRYPDSMNSCGISFVWLVPLLFWGLLLSRFLSLSLYLLVNSSPNNVHMFEIQFRYHLIGKSFKWRASTAVCIYEACVYATRRVAWNGKFQHDRRHGVLPCDFTEDFCRFDMSAEEVVGPCHVIVCVLYPFDI